MNFLLRNNDGLTLIEVLIAIFILVIISLFNYQIMDSTFRLRTRVHNEGDFYSSINLSLSILEEDISSIYSPMLMYPNKKEENSNTGEAADSDDMNAIITGDRVKGTQFWGSVLDKTGMRPAVFVGERDEISFISMSHVRIYKESPESVFSKVTYKLEEGDDSQVLLKTENPNTFDIEEDDGDRLRKYKLLYNIKDLSFRYYQKSKDAWHDKWDSQSVDFKDQYPDIIEVSLELLKGERLSFQGKYRFRPEVPLNGFSPSI